jgi:acyl-lipid omega-6 desaturase (Delta-12 desaturase)
MTQTAVPSDGAQRPRSRQRPFWRDAVAPYEAPDVRRSALDVATSIVPYLVLSVAMYRLLDVSYWLTLLVAIPAGGFLLRTYIVFHDCTHGSFLPSKRANTLLGVVCGLFVYSPFHAWKHEHAVHHATSSDLDRRGVGDVDMLTVREYAALSKPKRFEYRMLRNPLVMLVLGPIWALAIEPRFSQGNGRPLDRKSVIATDVLLAAVLGSLVWLIGWKALVLIQLPCIMLAGSAGVWLFYVQHQFDGVYWERGGGWSYADAALKGASHLKLPKVLQFFTGNIGLHHVHHLSARIPNYNLQRAHDENAFFHDVPQIGIREGIRALRLKVWDEEEGRLLTWKRARPKIRAAA